MLIPEGFAHNDGQVLIHRGTAPPNFSVLVIWLHRIIISLSRHNSFGVLLFRESDSNVRSRDRLKSGY